MTSSSLLKMARLMLLPPRRYAHLAEVECPKCKALVPNYFMVQIMPDPRDDFCGICSYESERGTLNPDARQHLIASLDPALTVLPTDPSVDSVVPAPFDELMNNYLDPNHNPQIPDESKIFDPLFAQGSAGVPSQLSDVYKTLKESGDLFWTFGGGMDPARAERNRRKRQKRRRKKK
jgi:hypothetical protein